jgi:hypothetical protein
MRALGGWPRRSGGPGRAYSGARIGLQRPGIPDTATRSSKTQTSADERALRAALASGHIDHLERPA